MIQIDLIHNDYTLEILTFGKSWKVQITCGIYEGKQYVSAIVSNQSLILDGPEPLLLGENISALYVRHSTLLDQIARCLEDDSVYIKKAESIPVGRERELFEILLNNG